MWYGGNYSPCLRNEQSRFAYSLIRKHFLDINWDFQRIRKNFNFPPILVARIRHLLGNEDFGRILEDS